MTRLSGRRGRACGIACSGILVVLGVTVSSLAFPAAAAVPQPVELTPTFIDTAADFDTPVVTGPACAVTFTSLTDARRDPVTAGNLGYRAVHAPSDVQAWLHAVLGGFGRRGVIAQFPKADAATAPGATDSAPSGPAAQLTLRMAWIQAGTMDLSANVIVSIDATGPGGRTLHQTYRGRVAKMNWSSSPGEVQRDVSYAFADFLDKAAPDLRQLCQP